MAPEHAAIGVQFVQHDIAEVLEKPHPLGMVRQDSRVQHVRVRQDNMSALSDRLARVVRGVAIVGENSKAVIEPLGKVVQLGELVLGQCFGRKQVKSTCVGIFQHCIQHRKVVAECFARRRRGYHDYVPAAVYYFGGGSLVRIQFFDPFCAVRLRKFASHPARHGPKLRLAGWNLPHRGQHFVCAVACNQRS